MMIDERQDEEKATHLRIAVDSRVNGEHIQACIGRGALLAVDDIQRRDALARGIKENEIVSQEIFIGYSFIHSSIRYD